MPRQARYGAATARSQAGPPVIPAPIPAGTPPIPAAMATSQVAIIGRHHSAAA